MMNIVTLAGGVGGAKLAHGLTLTPTPSAASPVQGEGRRGEGLTIIVNTGDDFEWHGLYVCPDLDTVTYALGGLANTQTGWGVAGDTFEALGALRRLGADVWFNVGDRDLATHVYRTSLLRQGKTLTEAMHIITRALDLTATILPMTDDRFHTLVETNQGMLEFQEYFVHRQWQPAIKRIIFDGAETAQATPQVISALQRADAIILSPSNPFVSIDPILSLTLKRPAWRAPDASRRTGRERNEVQSKDARSSTPLRSAQSAQAPIAAVSPIVGGRAIKGPAAKMFRELSMEPSALAVAQHYQGLVTHFVLDRLDAEQESAIQSLGMRTLVTNTIMQSVEDRARLAAEVVEFVTSNE